MSITRLVADGRDRLKEFCLAFVRLGGTMNG